MKNKVEFFRFKTNLNTIIYRDGDYFTTIWQEGSPFLGGQVSGFMYKVAHYEDNVIPLTTEEVADLAQKSKKVRELLGLATEVKR